MSTRSGPRPAPIVSFKPGVPSTAAMESAAEWMDLAERAGADPFVRPEWVLPWWSAFGRGRLDLFGVREGKQLRAVVPLVRHHGSLRSPTNWHSPLFGAVAETDGWLDRLADVVIASCPRRLTLDLLTSGERSHLAFVGAAQRRGCWVASGLRQCSPFLSLNGSWEDYRASLGQNLRRNARRYWRRLGQLGEARLDVEDGTHDLATLIDEGLQVEASGWKGRDKTAIASQPQTSAFYRDVAGLASQRGWLRLALLRLDGRAVAFDLCMEYDGVHYVLKTAYDESLSSLSPGLLLRHEMIRRAFELGLTRYELLGGDEPWKRDWMVDAHERLRLRVLPSGVSSAPERFLRGSQLAPVRWLRRQLADRAGAGPPPAPAC